MLLLLIHPQVGIELLIGLEVSWGSDCIVRYYWCRCRLRRWCWCLTWDVGHCGCGHRLRWCLCYWLGDLGRRRLVGSTSHGGNRTTHRLCRDRAVHDTTLLLELLGELCAQAQFCQRSADTAGLRPLQE